MVRKEGERKEKNLGGHTPKRTKASRVLMDGFFLMAQREKHFPLSLSLTHYFKSKVTQDALRTRVQ